MRGSFRYKFYMAKKNISQEKIIQSFLRCAFVKSAGATSLADIADELQIKKASLYNHFENREAMYSASIEYCGTEIANVNFLPEKNYETIKNNKTAVTTMFKRLITRYFNIYETEPCFEMYSFIHTEQYFNVAALNIIENENNSIVKDIKKMITAFISNNRIVQKTDKEIKEMASIIASIIIQQRDFYIAIRKETVRQNPVCDAGSLFALPTDETELNKTIKEVDSYLKLHLVTEA